jgi:hypothetical protein
MPVPGTPRHGAEPARVGRAGGLRGDRARLGLAAAPRAHVTGRRRSGRSPPERLDSLVERAGRTVLVTLVGRTGVSPDAGCPRALRAPGGYRALHDAGAACRGQPGARLQPRAAPLVRAVRVLHVSAGPAPHRFARGRLLRGRGLCVRAVPRRPAVAPAGAHLAVAAAAAAWPPCVSRQRETAMAGSVQRGVGPASAVERLLPAVCGAAHPAVAGVVRRVPAAMGPGTGHRRGMGCRVPGAPALAAHLPGCARDARADPYTRRDADVQRASGRRSSRRPSSCSCGRPGPTGRRKAICSPA